MKNSKMTAKKGFWILMLAASAVFALQAGPSRAWAEDPAEAVKVQEQETVEKIKAKQSAMHEVEAEAESILEEKDAIEEEAKLKAREAQILQEEADLLKEKAALTDDEKLRKKAEQAEQQARKLNAEAAAAKESLRLAESKSRLAQEKIEQDQKEIALLKRELYELKLNSAGLGGVVKWFNKPILYIGDSPVTLGGIGSAVFIILISLFISAIIQRVLVNKLSKAAKMRSGAVYAIGRVAHYLIVILALVLAAQCIGLNLGSLAVVFGFLSVGIGFGLQNITSNFISGLILLFERPISVGDFVTVDQQVGTVRQINMRSSLIETMDHVRIIVPNSKFIEGNVTNWSHGSTRVRIHCGVGVAYGSDVPKVKEALMGVALAHEDVLKTPPPQVRFMGFGDSSLDFELLVWIDEPENQYVIHSDINFAIDAAFRASDVTIPFPQRDLHIKSSEVKF